MSDPDQHEPEESYASQVARRSIVGFYGNRESAEYKELDKMLRTFPRDPSASSAEEYKCLIDTAKKAGVQISLETHFILGNFELIEKMRKPFYSPELLAVMNTSTPQHPASNARESTYSESFHRAMSQGRDTRTAPIAETGADNVTNTIRDFLQDLRQSIQDSIAGPSAPSTSNPSQ